MRSQGADGLFSREVSPSQAGRIKVARRIKGANFEIEPHDDGTIIIHNLQ